MAFPLSLCIIIVVIFSSIFLKNVLLAQENSVTAAYHSVPEQPGLILGTNEGYLCASGTRKKAKSAPPQWHPSEAGPQSPPHPCSHFIPSCLLA